MKSAIQFKNVSKRFVINHEHSRSVQELLISFLTRRRKPSESEEFWALRDVSFEIPQGKTVGIIGTNGSGKSTALKLMTGILQPTEGEIYVDGRISALLELGSGMHPELTGRENIFLNGSLLGLSNHEMRQLYPKIVDFSELKRFIDTPVKHYSSGMYMRLAFSVAIHVQPDILLLDEVLAVGDQSFQTKCLDRIFQMRKAGATIVMVSHGLEGLQDMCDELIWLNKGHFMGQGETGEMAGQYQYHIYKLSKQEDKETFSSENDNQNQDALTNQEEQAESLEDKEDDSQQSSWRWGSREVEITKVRFCRGDEYTDNFLTGDKLTIEMHYIAHQPIDDPMFGLAIHHVNGTHINGPNNKFAGFDIERIEGPGVIYYTISDLPLMQGTYDVTVSAYDAQGIHDYDVHWRAYPFQVHTGGTEERYGLIRIPAKWEIQFQNSLNGKSNGNSLHPQPPSPNGAGLSDV